MDNFDRLWAPWRLPYIKETASQTEIECFLCEAVQSFEDRQRLLLHREALCFVILNLYPYNNGHLLVTPNRHVADLDDLTGEELTALFELTRKAKSWLDKAMSPHGYNIGINLGRHAGAGLPGHLHVHIVPRWNGDSNFMPIIGGTKVISQGLQSTYDSLKKVIDTDDSGH